MGDSFYPLSIAILSGKIGNNHEMKTFSILYEKIGGEGKFSTFICLPELVKKM